VIWFGNHTEAFCSKNKTEFLVLGYILYETVITLIMKNIIIHCIRS